MHHEHHGDCCAPQEPHSHEHHDHLALPLGQLCCAGVCHHQEHQQLETMRHLPDRFVFDEHVETSTKKKKKTKRKAVAYLSLVAFASGA